MVQGGIAMSITKENFVGVIFSWGIAKGAHIVSLILGQGLQWACLYVFKRKNLGQVAGFNCI